MGRNKKTTDFLSDLELQIMNVVWRLRSATVHDVIERLPRNDYAYTTISTVMRVLEQKGALSPVKNGKSHIYVPQFSREKYEMKALEKMIDELFQGEPTHLVRRLLQIVENQPAELAEIQNYIEKLTSHNLDNF